jgi:hypothetical protein
LQLDGILVSQFGTPDHTAPHCHRHRLVAKYAIDRRTA